MKTEPTKDLVFSQDSYDLALHHQSYDTWIERLRNDERSPAAVMFEMLGDAMTPFFLFLADGFKGDRNTFAERAWVLIYCVRPDLLDVTTGVAAERRYGFSQGTLSGLVAQFEERFPGVAVKAKRFAWTVERKETWIASRRRNAAERKIRRRNFDTKRLAKDDALRDSRSAAADMIEFDRALGLTA